MKKQKRRDRKSKPLEQSLRHLTLNSGHLAVTARSDVLPEAREVLRPLVRAGGGELCFSMEGLHLHITHRCRGGAVFSVHLSEGPTVNVLSPSGDVVTLHGYPVITCGLAWKQEAIDIVGQLTVNATELAKKIWKQKFAPSPPVDIPWLMVVLYPWMLTLTEQQISALGDLERCIAWTIIDEAEKDGAQ